MLPGCCYSRLVRRAFSDILRQGYPASENPATRPLIQGASLFAAANVVAQIFWLKTRAQAGYDGIGLGDPEVEVITISLTQRFRRAFDNPGDGKGRLRIPREVARESPMMSPSIPI